MIPETNDVIKKCRTIASLHCMAVLHCMAGSSDAFVMTFQPIGMLKLYKKGGGLSCTLKTIKVIVSVSITHSEWERARTMLKAFQIADDRK